MLVGFVGRAGAGKDYAANTLMRMIPDINCQVYKMAGPIKEFCKEVFDWSDEHIDGSLKEVPNKYGVSPRKAMQLLGTEFGRTVDPDVWPRYCLRKIEKDMTYEVARSSKTGLSSWGLSRVQAALITDVRFPNEAKLVREEGGLLVRIEGSNGLPYNHASEQHVDGIEVDFSIDNRVWGTSALSDGLRAFLLDFYPELASFIREV